MRLVILRPPRTCSDGLDRRRRPYLLLNDANLTESMSCLMRTDRVKRRELVEHGPAERACTLGVTRHLKREDCDGRINARRR